ncbi:MAG TPA: hypothetical protein VNY78_01700 [Edaphobacter sp.]|nr:hypothetical protein [Edaphobacter sp.]
MTGYRESEMITMCNDVHPNIVVPFLIYECTGYYDKNRPNWKLMEDLAIDVNPRSAEAGGFQSRCRLPRSRGRTRPCGRLRQAR